MSEISAIEKYKCQLSVFDEIVELQNASMIVLLKNMLKSLEKLSVSKAHDKDWQAEFILWKAAVGKYNAEKYGWVGGNQLRIQGWQLLPSCYEHEGKGRTFPAFSIF
jgi:hypothetical protein